MVAVVRHPEGTTHDFGDARGSPQVSAIPVRKRSFDQDFRELVFLVGRETWRTAWRGVYVVYPVSLARSLVMPPHDRTGATVQRVGYRIKTHTLVN